MESAFFHSIAIWLKEHLLDKSLWRQESGVLVSGGINTFLNRISGKYTRLPHQI